MYERNFRFGEERARLREKRGPRLQSRVWSFLCLRVSLDGLRKKRDCSYSNKWSARNEHFSARKIYLSSCSGETFRTSANVVYDQNCSQLTELQDTFKINEKSCFCFCCWSLHRILNWQTPNSPDPLTSYPKLRSIYWRDSLTVITGQRLFSSAIRRLVEQAYSQAKPILS